MVVRRTLTPFVGVRFSHPQPPQQQSCCGFFSGCSAVGSALGSGQEAVGSNPVTPTTKALSPSGERAFVFHGVTGFEPTASPQRDTNSPVDCLRGCGRIRARLPHRALWTVPRQNSPRKNSQRANQQSHSRIFLRQYCTILSAAAAGAVLKPSGGNCAVLPLKIFPALLQKICQEHFQPLAAKSLFHHQ